MARRRRDGNLEELIRRFQEANRAPRARTSGRPNTTPQNLTKKRGMPGQRRFDRTQTFTRSSPPPPDRFANQWNARNIPGFGQAQDRKVQQRVKNRNYSYKKGRLVLDEGPRVSAFRRASATPPGSLGEGGQGQYRIPGLGEYGREKNIRAWRTRQGYPDGPPSRAGRGPFRPRRKYGRTRPTPGSALNRRPRSYA